MKIINKKYTDGKYKDDNSQYHKFLESVINKTKEVEALIERLMPMN